jgi:phage terminase large subunit-like protein
VKKRKKSASKTKNKKSARLPRRSAPRNDRLNKMPKPPRGCWFDEEAAERVVKFVRCLKHTKGKWAGQLFNLLPWQEKILRDMFGWKRRNGKRLYRTVYIEIPKKNGKSEFLAAILLYLTFADGEAGPEVYIAAADKDQSKIVFETSAKMFDMEPALGQYGYRVPSTYRIVNLKAGGFYRALSSDVKSKHGFNVSAAGIDELHAHPNRQLYDVLTEGSGDAREQPLFIIITTAGIDRNSKCWELHEKARQILNGTIKDPTFYAVLYGLTDEEEQEDPDAWKKEETWYRCNPSLGEIIDIETVREHYRKALENPMNENNFRQLRLNQWVKSSIKPIPLKYWDGCAGVIHKDKLLHRACYGGLDLASKIDLAALGLVFPDDKQPTGYDLIVHYWIPKDTMRESERKDKVPYTKWMRQGYVTATPGNVIDYEYILDDLDETRGNYDLKELAYDPFGSWEIIKDLQGRGFVIEEKAAGYGHPLLVLYRQGWKTMSGPTKDFIAMAIDQENRGRLRHGGNPVLRWNVDNLVLWQDKAGNVTPDKAKSTQKIDGVVASIMALDRALKHTGETRSAYEDGLITIG